MSRVVAPQDWDGPLHERPGLFARKDAPAPVDPDDDGADEQAPEPTLVVPAPERVAGPTDALPRSGSGVVKALGPGWTYRLLAARGPVVRTRKVLGDDGKNKNVKVPEQADSITLRLRHPDGRAAVAIWIDGKAEVAMTWTACTDPACPRGSVDHPADLPVAIGFRELKAWVTE